jgi:hypothetical protein
MSACSLPANILSIILGIVCQVLQDNDDDGETAAGGRLLHLLQIVNALNVVCPSHAVLQLYSSCTEMFCVNR